MILSVDKIARLCCLDRRLESAQQSLTLSTNFAMRISAKWRALALNINHVLHVRVHLSINECLGSTAFTAHIDNIDADEGAINHSSKNNTS